MVHVVGLRSDHGVVRFGLYNTKRTYEAHQHAFRGDDLPIHNRACAWRLDDIPYGDYAVMLYHDENNNRKFDTNFIGYPKESFGFSNNAKVFLAQPGYRKVKFSVARPMQTIMITVK